MRYVRDNSFVWKEINSESFILDIQNEKSHALNSTATLIWNALESEKTIEELCSIFTEQFEISDQVAKQDIQDTLASLLKLNLIKSK